MGSPLGSLMANAFLSSLEKKLERDNKLPNLYRRCVDDTITAMPDVAGAESFLSTLNECHPSVSFTMELARNNNTVSWNGDNKEWPLTEYQRLQKTYKYCLTSTFSQSR